MDEARCREAEAALWRTVGLRPTERVVDLHGARVRIQEVGSGEPLLFLHGGPDSGTSWVPLAGLLTDRRCLLVDRPGTGLSSPLPEPLTAANVAAFGEGLVAELCGSLGLDRVSVVGSSFGGYLALLSAATHPELVDRLVLLGCPAMVQGIRTPPFMKLLGLPGGRHLVAALPPSAGGVRSALKQIGHGASLRTGRIADGVLDWRLALQRTTDTMRHELAMIASAIGPRGFDPALTLTDELLGRVVAPTSVVWGADEAFGDTEVARRLVDALPDAELHVLPDAGHLPWLDDPATVATLVRDHLEVARGQRSRVDVGP